MSKSTPTSESTPTTTPTPNVHLLVIIHGMWGNPSHVAELERVVRETKGTEIVADTALEILVAQTNQEDSTYDGVDWGGERVAEEVSFSFLPSYRFRFRFRFRVFGSGN